MKHPILAAVASALALAATVPARAQAPASGYPNRAVRFIVPFSPGTAADIVGRQLGQRLSEQWGQPVVIENLQGTGGGIGAAAVAKATPDGHTLLMAGLNHAINPALYKDLPFDTLRDFKPVARVASGPLIFVASPAFQANTIGELVALAKSKPQQINYGSGGNGSITHLAFELLKAKTGIEMTHVPYKGVSQMLGDILGNQIGLGAPAVASVVSNVKAGKMKALGVTSARRTAALPDVPTVAESGVPGFDVSTWSGVLAPARTPDDIVAKIHADIVKVAQSKAFSEALQPQGLEPDPLGPAEFKTFFASEVSKWSQLVKDSGAKLD